MVCGTYASNYLTVAARLEDFQVDNGIQVAPPQLVERNANLDRLFEWALQNVIQVDERDEEMEYLIRGYEGDDMGHVSDSANYEKEGYDKSTRQDFL